MWARKNASWMLKRCRPLVGASQSRPTIAKRPPPCQQIQRLHPVIRGVGPSMSRLLSTSSGEISAEECARGLSRLSQFTDAASSSEASWMALSKSLSPEARREIMELAKQAPPVQAAAAVAPAVEVVPEPEWRDLKLVAMAQAIPFFGFGLMDNAILIIAGDAIDTSLGVMLGISTMCAAAIGNIISDVAGIMLGTVIEDFCANYLNIPQANLTQAQRQLRSVRFATQWGCAVGVVLGCIVGMFPLLFIDSKKIQAKKREAALEHIFQDVVTEAKKLIGAESTTLLIVVDRDPEEKNATPLPSPNGSYLYAKINHSDSGEVSHKTFKLGRGIVSRAALTGQAWNIHDVDSEPDFSQELSASQAGGNKIRNMVVVPVLDSQGKTIAVIRAFNKVGHGSIERGLSAPPSERELEAIQQRGFSQQDVQVLKALASHISVSLQYLYYQDSEEAEEMRVRDTIRILKEHGLAGIPEHRAPVAKQRPPLFPDDNLPNTF